MSITRCSNSEINEMARPIWLNLAKGSNEIDYPAFSRDFSLELKERITKERFASQCREFPLLTSLSEDFEFIDCIRRKDAVTVLWRLCSTELEGEFLGALTLEQTNTGVSVIGVSAN